MKLVEMGKVDLDIPVVEYLPRFKMRDERYKNITVRMLLNHSSGLPGSNYRNAISDRWTGENFMDEYYEYFSCSKLKAEPGSFSIYCNDGFELAAAIIENVSGQSYIEFVREYITNPIGAYSTGVADIAIEGRKMMSCDGANPEWLSAIGAGAIRTDLSDCARFGYLFINPSEVIKRESIDELCRSQGVTFLKNDNMSTLHGLGWDAVEFKSKKVNLGEHTLEKDGGTSQFESELIVSQEYGLSAAISGTMDCEVNFCELLCEMMAIVLEEKGYDVSVKEMPTAELDNSVEPIPEKWLNEDGKIFYASDNIYKVVIKEEKLSVWFYKYNGEWVRSKWYHDLQWNNGRFGRDELSVLFEEYQDKVYIIRGKDGMKIPFGQRNINYVPISEGWKNRVGKKYLACNVSAFDLDSAEEISLVIEEGEDEGVILFKRPIEGNIMPVVSYGNDDTDMFLNIPSYGSNDIYAPYLFCKDGTEYLRNGGYIYVDTERVSHIKSGIIKSSRKEENAIFKTKAGSHIEFNKPEDVAVFMLDENLSIVYNSHDDESMPEICDGYIIFANDSAMDFEVSVRKK
ncbi:serine hydrolase domain-containing protein [Oceanirhabdus seepicola]|uniref:Beta-lactamase family protein n=1 Tax=Oceanirhabdus seepicola TaxID=2828781 RepID=A0A9J6NYC9_9CLOT|nr:serine hydrolase domain-containing protein [Oceanirhabdus seepicola]MCM1988897.1 beta-lactamase family protein [Oceanirhabdus seepicola]